MATLELNAIPGADAPDTTAAPAAAPEANAPANVAEIVAKLIESGGPAASMDNLTKVYLKVRNSQADLKKQAALKMAPLTTALDLLEKHFLAKMLELGVDSLTNANGTPYKTKKTSITVEDNPTFLSFVLTRALAGLPLKDEAKEAIKNAMIESGQLALLEARAAKTACETYLEETKELPPGLKRSSEVTVNVRAS